MLFELVAELARRALRHDFLGSPLRLLLWLRHARSEHQLSNRLAGGYGFQTLGTFGEGRRISPKSSRRAHILGSGQSVTELTAADFALIARETSIGLNVWIAHPFVPDFYSLEGGRIPVTDNEVDHRLFLASELSSPRVRAKMPSLLILRPPAPYRDEQMVPVPDFFVQTTHLTGRANLMRAESSRGLRLDLRALAFLARARLLPPNVLPDNGASVVRMMFFALSLGCREIVLSGIDLNENPYFWYSPPDSAVNRKLRELFPRETGVPHDTTLTLDRPYDTREVIVELAGILRRHHGVTVWAGSKTSALAGPLGVFAWPRELGQAIAR
jgi:hypothetical protein